MGGCAPYSSFMGMFTSSTKMTYFLPAAGPKMPLRRFSHLLSSWSWIWFADVCAEKVMQMGTYESGKPPCKWREMFTVLPVPVGPLIITCLPFVTSVSSK